MKLKEIEIFDFKSIRHERIVVNSNQLCLVGINESGKTNFLEAISFLNIMDSEMKKGLINKSSPRYPKEYPLISGVFEISKDEKSAIIKILKKEDLKDIDINSLIKSILDTEAIEVKRWGNGFDNLAINIPTNKEHVNLLLLVKEKAEFLDFFFNSIYPQIEFYKDEDLLIEPATIEELSGNDRRFETFRRLLYVGGCENLEDLQYDDEDARIAHLQNIKESINEIFHKHYKQDKSIEILVSPAFNNKLVVSIKDSSKKVFSIHERSPGFQYYFSFLINKTYLNKIHKSKNIIYLLDEPGHSLHPQGAKDLLKTFDEIALKNQIFYTTHNPFLTIRNNIDSLYFVQKDSQKGSKVNLKPYLNKYQTLRKELGILLNDSFILGDINLVVEGITEKMAFHRLFNDNFENLNWLNIYNADGVGNISKTLSFLGPKNLNLSGLVIIDSDIAAKRETEKKYFKEIMTNNNWDYLEINSVFSDKKDRTFEDLFSQDLYIQAFNTYCNSLKDLEIFSRPYSDFPENSSIESPIITTLEEHFKSFLDVDNISKVSISKQDVMRVLLNKIESLPPIDKEKQLSNINKLIKLIEQRIKKITEYVNN